MERVEAPKQGESILRLWRPVAACVAFVNAFLNLKIRTTTGKNRFRIERGNAVLELNIAAVVKQAAAALLPWTPYAAPDLSGGSPPADQGRRFMVRPGAVTDGLSLVPVSNANQVFLCPPKCTGGFYVWLRGTVSIEGALTALSYESGTVLPTGMLDTDDGSGNLPADTYLLLCTVFSDETSVLYASTIQHVASSLSCTPGISDVQVDGAVRRMQWSALATLPQ